MLWASSSAFRYNDYDNWNTNSNVSSHLCDTGSVDLANSAKNNEFFNGALVSRVLGRKRSIKSKGPSTGSGTKHETDQ